MFPDSITGCVVGWLCVVVICYLVKHCDDFGDGNVGSDE